ncbi:MAG TPA: hypothetical protein VK504_08205 [Vicinamibacterales bacterium]|nr:hypothetical protein [Vicinamibacterales bacterium]
MIYPLRALLVAIMLFPVSAAADAVQTYNLDPANFHLGFVVCSPPGPYGSDLVVLGSGTYRMVFTDSLPLGAKVTHVRVTVPMSRATNSGVGPSASIDINDGRLGTVGVVNSPGNCVSGLSDYVYDVDFPTGFGSYVNGGLNTFAIEALGGGAGGTVLVGLIRMEVTWTIPYDVEIDSGDGQTGAVTGPLAGLLRVKLMTKAQASLAGQPVLFTVTQAAGSGAAVGTDELATSQSHTATVDATGHATAMMLLGDKSGKYTVTAQNPSSPAAKFATFTATAIKPSSVRIALGQPEVPAAPSFVVSLLQTPKFYALGVDAQGQKIGRMKCAWSAAAKGKGAGAGTVNLPADGVSTVTFSPKSPGIMTISANPSVSGTATAKSDLLIGGVYLQVGESFDPSSPLDDLPRFVPGSDLQGRSLPLPDPADGSMPIQTVTLHLLSDPGQQGTVSYALTGVTRYPGIAMNWPITSAGIGFDLDFGASALSTPDLKFDTSGDTKTKLFVYDYGAAGHLTATITTAKKKFVIEIDLPTLDRGLPSAGWNAGGVAVSAAGLTAEGDTDDSEPVDSVGDGFSNYEEYRGFSVQGSHLRTSPHKKDLFIDMDELVERLWDGKRIIDKLPLAIHYLSVTEDAGLPLLPRADRASPIVDVNRAAVPGARQLGGQRALRIIYQAQHEPSWENPALGSTLMAHSLFIFGLTIPDYIADVNTINSPRNVDFSQCGDSLERGPDHTQWVEVYPKAITNTGLHVDFSRTYFDKFGTPVRDCALWPADTNCDDYREDLQMILTHRNAITLPNPTCQNPDGTRDWSYGDLNTEIDLALFPTTEWYSNHATRCGSLEETSFSLDEVETLKTVTVAHEAGHGVAMEHTADCNDIMYTRAAGAYPLVQTYSVVPDIASIRLTP